LKIKLKLIIKERLEINRITNRLMKNKIFKMMEVLIVLNKMIVRYKVRIKKEI
jgi:hypothetical protein